MFCHMQFFSYFWHSNSTLMEKHRANVLMICCFLSFWLLLPASVGAQSTDSVPQEGGLVHRIAIEADPSLILHTNKFLKGKNIEGRTMNHAFSAKLKYAFQLPQNSMESIVYKDAYQGVGVAYHDFNPELGYPVSFFIFQGARIKSLSSRLSLNYEWNLGLTSKWKPYDPVDNPDNKVIGSKVTAYIDLDFYFKYRLSRFVDLDAGLTLTHFSNGNTKIPNAGLNILGAKLGLAYYINRQEEKKVSQKDIPSFQKHISYDLVFYGAWRRQGYYTDVGPVLLPGSYGVFGFNFNPLYNINHWLNAGISLDGVYDRSANLTLDEVSSSSSDTGDGGPQVSYPSAHRQMALGLSARAEFIMPYFTINFGMGNNIIGAKGDLKQWYQLLALKLGVTRHTFIHIGYCLHNFRNPNNLMLGIGYHFNYKRRSNYSIFK